YAAEKKAEDEARQKRMDARDADWDKLADILSLDEDVVSPEQKKGWAGEFLRAYSKSPGLDPAMAKALLDYAPAPARASLKALARRAAEESPSMRQADSKTRAARLNAAKIGIQ